MITLVLFLFLNGRPDIPIERTPMPDLATCLERAREAMKYGQDLADHVRFYDDDGVALPPYEVLASCRTEERE